MNRYHKILPMKIHEASFSFQIYLMAYQSNDFSKVSYYHWRRLMLYLLRAIYFRHHDYSAPSSHQAAYRRPDELPGVVRRLMMA